MRVFGLKSSSGGSCIVGDEEKECDEIEEDRRETFGFVNIDFTKRILLIV